MYILELNQEGSAIEVGLFSTIEEGRKFISQLPGYKSKTEDGFLYEYVELDNMPDYLELTYNNNVVPFTKFMFVGNGRADIYWKEINDLSIKGNGMIPGATRVDAYSIENEDLKNYIENREKKYNEVKERLEKDNYEVTRAYFGSEDGEAILYRLKNTKDWHFLTHMDPSFCETEDIEDILEDIE